MHQTEIHVLVFILIVTDMHLLLCTKALLCLLTWYVHLDSLSTNYVRRLLRANVVTGVYLLPVIVLTVIIGISAASVTLQESEDKGRHYC